MLARPERGRQRSGRRQPLLGHALTRPRDQFRLAAVGAHLDVDVLSRALVGLEALQLVVVPASGLDLLYQRFRERGRFILASREEEAVGLAAGLALGGARPLVVMQQSGVGNALNAVFTLAEAYDIRFPILVVDRGLDDDNPVQRVSSALTGRVLAALGVRALAAETAEALPTLLTSGQRWFSWQMGRHAG
jgi:sulfopyruvate decarboxylase TPP-binding subunit